jgi:fatty-acyl-CoA synthase
MPGIEDAQVVGVPDAKYGEVVGAFVRRSPGSDIGESDIQEFARARLAHFKAPKHVFFVDEFPLTASGKVQKYKLRELAQSLLGVHEGVFAADGEDGVHHEASAR